MRERPNTHSQDEDGHSSLWVDRSPIQSVLLGQYVFGKGIELYHATGSAREDLDMTAAHEAFHFHVCASTPFGIFQRSLGKIATDSDFPEAVRSHARRALQNSVDQSWFAHEGAATFSELFLTALARGTDAFVQRVKALPAHYKQAVDAIIPVLFSLDVPLLALSPVCDAIAFLAFSTSILLDAADWSSVERTDWARYFTTPAQSPNLRLRHALELLNDTNVRCAVAESIFNLTLRELSCSLDEFPSAYGKQSIEQQRSMQDAVFYGVIADLSDSLPFSVEHPTAVHQQHLQFTIAWNKMLKPLGSELPLADPVTSAGISAEMRYLLDNMEARPAPEALSRLELLLVPAETVQQIVRARGDGSILYIKIHYNWTNDFIGRQDDPLRIPPGGAMLLVHDVRSAEGTWQYESPVHADGGDVSQNPAGFVLASEMLGSFLAETRLPNCILAIDEGPHISFQRHFGSLIGIDGYPLITIASMAAPSYWTDLILPKYLGSDCWIVHTHDIPGWGQKCDCLIAGTLTGYAFFIRPAPAISSWLLKRVGPARYQVPELSDRTLMHLRTACAHYSQFGW